jgi:hypothetical protein
MNNVQAPITNVARSAPCVLSPDVAILGPKFPRRLCVIPDWVEPSQCQAAEVWSKADEDLLNLWIEGTTPTGRELIQKAMWRLQKEDKKSDSFRSILSPDELALLEATLAQDESQGLRDNLWRVDYRHRPPSMEEFITDTHYLGAILHPQLATGIWPAWFKTLCDEFDRDSILNNVILTGALGTGKTTVMVVALLYRICHVLLLKRPAEMFGQGAGASLYFVIISITREAALQTAFSQAASLMASSPFFRATTRIMSAGVQSGGDIELGETESNETHTPLHLISGSKAQHLIGRNIIGIGFDEGNYRLERDQDDAALELYAAMRNRLLSRLKTREGYLPGITIIASSARDESSVTEQVRLEIEAAAKPREHRVFQQAIYEVKPLPDQMVRTYFKVAYGLTHQEPALLGGTYDKDGKRLDEPTDADPVAPFPGAKITLVPTMYREAFQRNCRLALQDICGISCGGWATIPNNDRCGPVLGDFEAGRCSSHVATG